jgi:hypothetical protein
MRLGELLVDQGVIDEQQLKKALDAQMIYGGHLGTCLIELGYVDDESLGRVLAQAQGVDYVQRELLLEAQQDAISVLPKAIVEKHAAVPFRMQERLLHVAMVEPRNLVGVDEVAFASGHPVRAFISPEVVVFHAMERFYKIPRQPRYIAVGSTLNRPKQEGSARPAEPHAAAKVQAVSTAATVPVNVASVPKTAAQQAWSSHLVDEGERVSFGKQSLAVHWVKRTTGSGDSQKAVWCNLFDLPLNHEHFDNLEGVYVVWHRGVDPVLCVGQGLIREELDRLLRDATVRSEHEGTGLYVTWAPIPREQRNGVEGYLAQTLNPMRGGDVTTTSPISVNLPE